MLRKAEIKAVVALGLNPEIVAFWRCRVAGTPPCSRSVVLRLMEAHSRAVDRLEAPIHRVNALAARIRSMHVELNDICLIGEMLPMGRNLDQCWNPKTDTWEEDIEYPDYSKSLKIIEDYRAKPPLTRRRATAAWSGLTLAFGREPERLHSNRRGYFGQVTDFRGKVLTFTIDAFKPRADD